MRQQGTDRGAVRDVRHEPGSESPQGFDRTQRHIEGATGLAAHLAGALEQAASLGRQLIGLAPVQAPDIALGAVVGKDAFETCDFAAGCGESGTCGARTRRDERQR
jgi:hypothetical protein